MPNTILQLEQRLEPFIEWFNRLTASSIDPFASAAAVELSTCQTSSVCFVARLHNLPTRFGLRATLVLSTQKAPACSLSSLRVFDTLAHMIGVVSTVGRDVLGRFGKIVDLLREGLCFFGGGCSGRGQQRKDGAAFRGRHHNLEAVALHPAIVLRTTPLAVTVNSVQTLGNAVLLACTDVPQRPACSDQTLIDGHIPGVGNALCNRLFPLQLDGVPKELMSAPVAVEVSAARRKMTRTDPGFQITAMFRKEPVLRRLALFSLQNCDHNQYSQYPGGNVWLATWTRPRAFTFSLLAQRHRHLDQRRQTRARLGTLTHPWDLHRALVSTVVAET